MKVYIVLASIYNEDKDSYDVRVDHVYRTRLEAMERDSLLSKNAEYGSSYHVIEKTLKGKPPLNESVK